MKIPLALLSLCLTASMQLPAGSAPPEYPWMDSLDKAEALAKESGKPMLAVFR